MAKQSGWVTINGVHVFIDGKSGKITQGPAKFIGSTLNDLPSNKSSQADLKARLQAKHTTSDGKEIKPYTQNESVKNRLKESSKSSPKVTAANDYSSSFARELTTQERKENEKFRSNAKELSKEVFKYDVSKFSDSELAKREKVLDKRLKERIGEKIDGDWRRDFCELNDIKKELKSRSNSPKPSNESSTTKSKRTTGTAKPKTGNTTFDNATSTKKATQTRKSKNSIVFSVKRTDGTTVKMNEKEFSAFLKERQKSNTPVAKTGNSNFDNATKSNKATSGRSSSGLSVTHYDGFGRRGSWNEYRINGKKVSAKEAKAQFPDMFGSNGRYNGGKK